MDNITERSVTVMIRYAAICPYFGKLPNNFGLWLLSCRYNPNIDFIVITDDRTKFEIPVNVKIIYMNFFEMKSHIQNCFKFKISLETPYKLCDYKPAYGYIFENLFQNYDYWGYCDLDVVFGNIMKYLPKNIEFDKISNLSHLCFVKNTEELRTIFMKAQDDITYKDIFSSNVHFGFDEIGNYGFNCILESFDKKIYDLGKNIADISTYAMNFSLSIINKRRWEDIGGQRIFLFNAGKLEEYLLKANDEIEKNEYAYVHIQKRVLDNNISNESLDNLTKFIISPKGFLNSAETITPSYIKETQKIGIYFPAIDIRFKAAKKRIIRRLEICKIKRNKG